MKFPSKEFPVMTIPFLWYFSFEQFPGTQLKMCFPQCHFIILNYTSVVYPFGMKHFLRHLLNQIACCAQPYWDSLCDSFYFFLQREYHPSPGKFYSLSLALWSELLPTNVVFRQNARFQILSHGFDVSLKLKQLSDFSITTIQTKNQEK